MIIGIVVGVVLFIGGIIATIFIVRWIKKRKTTKTIVEDQ